MTGGAELLMAAQRSNVWQCAAEVWRICTLERSLSWNGRSLKTGVDAVSDNTREQLNTLEFLVMYRSSN